MATTQTASKSSNGTKASTADIDKQIAQIKSDIAALTDTISEIGANRAAGVKADAEEKIRELSESVRHLASRASETGARVQGAVKENVQEHPLQAIGLAALVGFALAFMVRK